MLVMTRLLEYDPVNKSIRRTANLVDDFETLLVRLVETPYTYRETLIHAQTGVPIASFFAPNEPVGIQVAIHGVWQMTRDGESIAAYIGGKNKDGLLLKKLKQIEGAVVTEAVFLSEKFNLFLEFNDETWLRLFCSPLRHEAYYITQETPTEIDEEPVCQSMRYCVYHKGMVRGKWNS